MAARWRHDTTNILNQANQGEVSHIFMKALTSKILIVEIIHLKFYNNYIYNILTLKTLMIISKYLI